MQSSDEFNESDSDEDYDSQDYDDLKADRKLSSYSDSKEWCVYCAICAGKHSELQCPNKNFSKSH
jgi:hypothetical protein